MCAAGAVPEAAPTATSEELLMRWYLVVRDGEGVLKFTARCAERGAVYDLSEAFRGRRADVMTLQRRGELEAYRVCQ